MKVNIVFSMNAKTHVLNAFPKVKFFDYINFILNQRYEKFGKIRRTGFITKSSKKCQIAR